MHAALFALKVTFFRVMNNNVLYGLVGIVVIGLIGYITVTSNSNVKMAKTETAMVKSSAETMAAEKKDMEQQDSMLKTNTVVDVAAGNPDFSTLVAAVNAAGLVEALSAPGPITVFAPTNAAFAKLPAGTVETLLKPENKQKLVDILKYHVVAGKVLSSDLQDGQKAPTLLGKTVKISLHTGVTVNASNVIKADLETSNGVIHVIDTVLLPE
jgi:uncharacterized surface protein with fasciclin (FAS1) repeats